MKKKARITDNFDWAMRQLRELSAEFKSLGMLDHYAQVEAIAFLLQTPEYYICHKNFKAIEKYGMKNGLEPSRENLAII